MLSSLYNEFISEINCVEITPVSSVFKLFLSLVLGGVVGIERKRKGQLAGIRTFALISMGATLAMILSIYIPQVYLDVKSGDPSRIAAQVITGIGFLGAGAIIQTKGSIRGLTTAAGIWMVAAIGLSIGVGMYMIAVISTVFVLFTLVSLERYEHRLSIERTAKIIKIECDTLEVDIVSLKQIYQSMQIIVHDLFLEYDYAAGCTSVEFVVLTKNTTDFQALFSRIRQVQPKITSIIIRNELK